MLNQRRRLLQGMAAAATLPFTGLVQAQQYPADTVRIVVPFAAGGVTDIVNRIIAQNLSEALGRSFIIDNRPGVGGNLGATLVAKSRGDGYTLLGGTLSTYALNAGMYPNLGHDPLTDLKPVAVTALVPIVLVASPSLGVKNMAELIRLLKANPDKYAYASAGNGTSAHVALHMFLQQSGTKALHIPYKGTSQGLIDVMSGQVAMTVASPAVALDQIRSKKLIAIAAISPTRLSALPDVPTVAEVGLKEFNAYSWNGLYAPASTPVAILDILNAGINKVLATPAVRAKLEEQGTVPMQARDRAATERFMRSEYDRWVPFVRQMGLTLG